MVPSKHLLAAGITVIVLILAAFLFVSWLGARDAQARLQSTVETQKTIIAQAQQQMRQLVDAQKVRDDATQKQLQLMSDAVAKIRTPEQIAQWIPQQLPTAQPVTVNIPASTPQAPNPPATFTVQQSDLPVIRDAIEGCKECTVKLDTAQKDLESRIAQMQLASDQIAAIKRERDAALKAAKGGAFWQRTKRAAKWAAIGIAIGYTLKTVRP